MSTTLHNLTTGQLRKVLDIKEQIERLQEQLESITGGDDTPVAPAAKRPKKRRMSAAGRARIAAAARARWAKLRAQKTKPVKKKRRVSAAVKARLAAIARERWRKAKEEGKTRL